MEILRKIIKEIVNNVLEEGRFDRFSGEVTRYLMSFIKETRIMSKRKNDAKIFYFKRPKHQMSFTMLAKITRKKGDFSVIVDGGALLDIYDKEKDQNQN